MSNVTGQDNISEMGEMPEQNLLATAVAEQTGDTDRQKQEFLSNLLCANNSYKKSCVLATKLLDKFGSLTGVMSANIDDLAATRGIGLRTAEIVKLSYTTILDICGSSLQSLPVLDHKGLINMVVWSIGDSQVEKLLIVYLNRCGRVTGQEILCVGSERWTGASPKVIVSAALRKGAAAFVLAHNHPSGSVDPSDDDLILTRRVVHAAHALDIHLTDHIIVSNTVYFSFRAMGFV